jgi:hypothetical protein
MKTISLLLLIIFVQSEPTKIKQGKADSLLANLKKKISDIDKYEYQHRKEMNTFISIEGKKGLKKVKNEDWPDDTEYIYHVLKDASGKVILTEQMPYSQSGDWYEEFKHYYDSDGKTIAFSKRETVFDESVKDGVVMQSTLKYYDKKFNLIAQTNNLNDSKGKLIKRKAIEFNFRDDKYVIYKTVNDCLKGYHIIPPQ